MNTTPRTLAVRCDEDSLWVDLDDGRTIGVPVVWFPRLFHASEEARKEFFLSPAGIHWKELNEDISVAGLLAGRGDMTIRAFCNS
jgi:Protein of unknown function (DUF2442)